APVSGGMTAAAGDVPRPPFLVLAAAAPGFQEVRGCGRTPATRRRPPMKAASYERYGPAADVLRVAEMERPEPGPGAGMGRGAFSGVNPTDRKTRSGATPRPIDRFQ